MEFKDESDLNTTYPYLLRYIKESRNQNFKIELTKLEKFESLEIKEILQHVTNNKTEFHYAGLILYNDYKNRTEQNPQVFDSIVKYAKQFGNLLQLYIVNSCFFEKVESKLIKLIYRNKDNVKHPKIEYDKMAIIIYESSLKEIVKLKSYSDIYHGKMFSLNDNTNRLKIIKNIRLVNLFEYQSEINDVLSNFNHEIIRLNPEFNVNSLIKHSIHENDTHNITPDDSRLVNSNKGEFTDDMYYVLLIENISWKLTDIIVLKRYLDLKRSTELSYIYNKSRNESVSHTAILKIKDLRVVNKLFEEYNYETIKGYIIKIKLIKAPRYKSLNLNNQCRYFFNIDNKNIQKSPDTLVLHLNDRLPRGQTMLEMDLPAMVQKYIKPPKSSYIIKEVSYKPNESLTDYISIDILVMIQPKDSKNTSKSICADIYNNNQDNEHITVQYSNISLNPSRLLMFKIKFDTKSVEDYYVVNMLSMFGKAEMVLVSRMHTTTTNNLDEKYTKLIIIEFKDSIKALETKTNTNLINLNNELFTIENATYLYELDYLNLETHSTPIGVHKFNKRPVSKTLVIGNMFIPDYKDDPITKEDIINNIKTNLLYDVSYQDIDCIYKGKTLFIEIQFDEYNCTKNTYEALLESKTHRPISLGNHTSNVVTISYKF